MSDLNNLSFWRPIATLRGHLSSVRALALSSHHTVVRHKLNDNINLNDLKFLRTFVNLSAGNTNNFILFTGGGRAEINAWKLSIVKEDASTFKNMTDVSHTDVNSQNDDLSHNVNSTYENAQNSQLDSIHNEVTLIGSAEDCSTQELDFRLNIKSSHKASSSSVLLDTSDQIKCNYQHVSTYFLGESRHKRFHWKSHRLRLDPETRVMSLDASSVADLWNGVHDKVSLPEALEHLLRVHIVSCAGSDGIFRCVAYTLCVLIHFFC